MASDYSSFDVLIDNDNGTTTPVLAATISVYDVTHDVALADLESDANGHVDSGAFDVDAGTVIRFSVALPDGQCGFKEEVTV